jgi:hypothetical protein
VAGAWVAGEGLTALLLALPAAVGFAAWLAALEFGCLTTGSALLVAQRRGFACSCFGGGGSPLNRWTVLRNGLLSLAALVLALVQGLPASAAPAPVILAAVLSVLGGAVLVGNARPLGALIGRSMGRGPARRSVAPGSALAGGRR